MNVNDQMKVAEWVRKRAEKIKGEVEAMMAKPNDGTLDTLVKECQAHGRVLGMMEIARDVLDDEWLSTLTDETGID